MQAQRKFEEPVVAPRAEPEAEFDRWTPRLASAIPGQAPPSPAHLLWDELAARLQEQPMASTSAVAGVVEIPKWPMPVRLAAIVGLSIAAWSATYWVAVAII